MGIGCRVEPKKTEKNGQDELNPAVFIRSLLARGIQQKKGKLISTFIAKEPSLLQIANSRISRRLHAICFDSAWFSQDYYFGEDCSFMETQKVQLKYRILLKIDLLEIVFRKNSYS